MNLKVLGFSTVAATALTAVAFTAAPTQAADITVGSVLNLSSPAQGGVFFSGTTLDFRSAGDNNPDFPNTALVTVGESTGRFEGARSLPVPLARIRDLNLTSLGGNLFGLSAPVTNFLAGIDLVNPPIPDGNDVQFTLTKFIYNAVTGDTTALEGFFIRGSQTIAGSGRFTSQPDISNPSSYSLSITAVPTPALLPGLVGFGVAALRKRKREATAQAEA